MFLSLSLSRGQRLALALDDALLVDVFLFKFLEDLLASGGKQLALTGLELKLELVDRVIQILDRVVAEDVGLAQGVEHLGVATEVVEQLALKAKDVFDRNLIELAVGACPDRDDLVFDRVRRVLRLAQQLGESLTPGELTA